MGSNINVIFSDVVGSVETVGMDFLEFVEHEFSGVLDEYFCEVGYLDDDPSLDLFNYRSDLDGHKDLRERLTRLGGGQFSCETFLGFTSADMDIVVFQARQFRGTGSTVTGKKIFLKSSRCFGTSKSFGKEDTCGFQCFSRRGYLDGNQTFKNLRFSTHRIWRRRSVDGRNSPWRRFP